ncbi:MAG: peptidoglycan recognition family protein [Chloroflexi bacterium]|nr:peptidoglycan recognition family protein [Chloroflexota bacterium]
MPRQPHAEKRRLSRRDLLRRLTLLGALGGMAGFTVARLNRPRRVVVLPYGGNTAQPEEPPTIISRDAWGALPVDISAPNERGVYEKGVNPIGWYVYPGDLRDSYQTLVIHHSAFYKADGIATLLEVQRLHRGDRGWADVGYHYLIDKDGAIYEGRNIGVRGVHTQGHNTGSAGVCLLGDFRYRSPTSAQWEGLASLSRWLIAELDLTHLAAHNQFNEGTLCPGAAVLNQLPALAESLGVGYGIEGYVPTADTGRTCPCHSPL